ncbi:DUF4355 domain-containing protein (plasmid) [Lysinibacillus capsici]|uniref:DUF4355 domain-containing protein n=1 Tax=Lysinibacillus capsici TaxID=2115968 RepID=UPI0021DA2107|nr:DUF4355 domain-containing protein [Lysinibacillus capsici]UYB50175.1 DUF4355 domain-containing protein [Lysinibacillus capsici]UYB50252.1 DUF4355 domain-containing protein [Lysinibacillus capsici]
MKVNFETLKTLVEAGDKSAFEKHIFESLEKGDVVAAASNNALVKSELDSEKDKHHNTALETWKTNQLQILIDEEVSKRNPQETPEQKRIRELEEKLESQEKENARKTLRENAIKYATDKGHNATFATKWIDKLLGDDETVTNATLDDFKTDFDAIVQAQVEEKLKGANRNPGGGSGGGTDLSTGARVAQQNQNKNAEEQQKAFFG